MGRVKSEKKKGGGVNYFAAQKDHIEFVKSGCVLLDCVLGGGWARGRMANIVGDKSSGKTLLAIEACANSIRQYPTSPIWYREAEAAFDREYAAALGMPIAKINPGEKRWKSIHTVEDFFEDLTEKCAIAKKAGGGLYIVDSLDALSDRAELERKIDEGSYNLNKQKILSQMFRRLVQDIEEANVMLLIVSQVRANIGVMFGEKTTRAGGKALDFYASQIVKLAHKTNLTETQKGIKRIVGLRVKAKATKNKVGLPLRECEFTLRFGFGVESVEAGLEWLIEIKRPDALGLSLAGAKDMLDDTVSWSDDKYREHAKRVDEAVWKTWTEVETSFLPIRRKYT